MSVIDPKNGIRWDPDSAEDAYFVSKGRIDLAPGLRRAGWSESALEPGPAQDPGPGSRYASMEDWYLAGCGQPDLAIGGGC